MLLISILAILMVSVIVYIIINPNDENDIVNRTNTITLYPNLHKQLEKELAQHSGYNDFDKDDERNIPTAMVLKLSLAISYSWEIEAMAEALTERGTPSPETLVLADLRSRFDDQHDYIANWENGFDKDIYLSSRALYEDSLKYQIYRAALKTWVKEELSAMYGDAEDDAAERAVREIISAKSPSPVL